jgi:hypothetical protein
MTAQQTEQHIPQQLTPSVNSQTTTTGYTATHQNKSTAIKELQDYARANYEDGGHWVYEAFDCADYQEVLNENNGNMELCKARLKHHWQQMCMLEREYAFDDE